MGRSPRKRNASRSPEDDRRPKRLLTSSPEEGELDDTSTPFVAPTAPPPSLPPKPSVGKAKIPFPFKKKNEPPRSGNGTSLDKSPSAVNDVHKLTWAPDTRPGRSSDHWEPSHGYEDRSAPSRQQGSRRHRHSRSRDRRGHRSPPLSFTPTRSRSSVSPLNSRREKHRLPAPRTPRTPEATFSPPSRNYDLDRRERSRDRPEWDRDRGHRGYRDEDDPWKYNRRSEGDSDRYYRPQPQRRDHRDWTRRDDGYEADRHHYDRHYDRPRGVDSYRPQSLQSEPLVSPPPPPPAQLPSRPPSPAPLPPRPPSAAGPRPPSSSPPPAPPPDARLSKDSRLPSTHPPVSIAISRPPAPRNIHSPLSLGLPPKPKESVKDEGRKAPEPPQVRAVRKREPVTRSRKEEAEAYGRTFTGCGIQSDYEVMSKLGEGTFGEVHKAIHKTTGASVALKRILMHHEKEGMPVTALREIKILKALKHPCIVEILDMFVVRSSEKDPLSVYMVFPYMDHDLAGLLENERVKLQPSHIKLYMKQLLEGTEYMHRNHILHRDMKAANLLISNSGSLRIADFGLARSFDANVTNPRVDNRGRERKYTNCVVTRWYRPPELLLGARQYGGEVDIWGIGCVLGEMFTRKPILPGTSDLDQLEKIWKLCGTPNQHSWPNYDALPGCEGVKRFYTHQRRVKPAYETVGLETADLLDKLLICNPRERITASQALDHDYFWTDPLPADPKTLPSYEASHEYDKRGHRNIHGGPPAQPRHHDGHLRPSNLPPPIGHHPRNHRGGPPPPRDMFNSGPPRDMFNSGAPPHNGGYPPNPPPPNGLPPPTRGPPNFHPSNQGPHRPGPPPGQHHGPPYGRGPPGGPPGSYPPRQQGQGQGRPGHQGGGGPGFGRREWESRGPGAPLPRHSNPNLPPRPPAPLGAPEIRESRGGPRGSGPQDKRGEPNGTGNGAGGLNYG
ncbi:hypothetical protein K443DRAFT_680230 [Laccaria amethystina LaAM-08-1]|uniref:Protein kinase domain-containing protein n=1 Tax=Laccaria amethystina LaAM-08-1 TaxID=1095629 RepID=A0A0C9XC52_9AGAR|nr:hypothetical protein K443DRAFT_680230 [Laccaria amethystina LaAM-08-1]